MEKFKVDAKIVYRKNDKDGRTILLVGNEYSLLYGFMDMIMDAFKEVKYKRNFINSLKNMLEDMERGLEK